MTTDTCRGAQTRPFLLNLPRGNTRQSVCLKKSPSHACAGPQRAADVPLPARRARAVPGLLPHPQRQTRPDFLRLLLPSSPASLLSRIPLGTQNPSCSHPASQEAQAPLPLQKGDLILTVRWGCWGSAALSRDTAFQGHLYTFMPSFPACQSILFSKPFPRLLPFWRLKTRAEQGLQPHGEEQHRGSTEGGVTTHSGAQQAMQTDRTVNKGGEKARQKAKTRLP